ncbi:hypothetical protein [Pyxidicoccus trucidator]|uniref:hypothetical protein n=1 Tax=Pyxidicoccus trucidator TaxID=2709662 RepID=UPI0013DC7DFF|nr:hypothetical protein [Pyxidicoccus trucidator]
MTPRSLTSLLGLAFALLTTACRPGYDQVEAPASAETTTVLSPSEPLLERRLHVRVAPKPGEKLEFLQLNFFIELTRLSWDVPEGAIPEVHPWFRVRVFDERDGLMVDEHVLIVAGPETPPGWPLSFGPELDEKARVFENTYRIEFERQGPPSEGTLQVDWKPGATALTSIPDMEHLQFSLTLL